MGQKGIPWDSVPLTEHVFSLTFRMTASIKAKVRLKRGRQAFRVDSILDNFQFSLPKKKKKRPKPLKWSFYWWLASNDPAECLRDFNRFLYLLHDKALKMRFSPFPPKEERDSKSQC